MMRRFWPTPLTVSNQEKLRMLAVLAHKPSFDIVLFPFLLNSVLLVVAGLVYNNLTARPYPHHSKTDRDDAHANNRFTKSDLNAALEHYQQIIDVDPADLAQLLQYAESAAYQRTLGDLRCEEVMSRSPHAVEFGSSLSEAWGLMRRHRIKALPVVDRARRVVGIITMADFLKHAQSYLAELLPLFSQTGHHHLPVIDSENRLIGILTQTDVVSALAKAVRHV